MSNVSPSKMLSGFLDYDEVLLWLLSEVEEARNRGILGEAGPQVAKEHRDEQAEDIETSLVAIKDTINKLNSANDSKAYAWYSPRAVAEMVFGPQLFTTDKSSLRAQIDGLANRTYNLTRSTAHFRERYVHIYKAAFYATLPEQTVRHEVCIRNDSIKSYGITSVVGVGLRVEQSKLSQYSHLVMELDTAHTLDKTLVSLSIDMAGLLETVWKKSDSIEVATSNLTYRAGDFFQDLLVASQGNIFIRMSISSFLAYIYNVIVLLKRLLSPGGSEEMPAPIKKNFLVETSLARQRQIAEAQSIRHQAIQALDDLRREIDFLISRDAITKGNTDDLDLMEHEEFENEPVSASRDHTFKGITQRLRESCTLEKFDENTQRQNNSSSVVICDGGFASVYKVKLAEERNLNFRYRPKPSAATVKICWSFDEVAVKVLHLGASEGTLSLRALREFMVWSQMHHPNIIPLVGLWFNFENANELPAFVSPWVEHGSLASYLSVRKRLRRKRRLCLLLDIAKALAYMHNHHPRVCHGDINPENILIINGRAYINDFGISHISAPDHGLTTNPHGDWRYRAPELLKETTGSKPTPQSDMYSFGLLCYKVLTDLAPWDANGVTEGMRIINPRTIIPRPETMSETDYDLLRYCWKRDPRLRATANVAVAKLKELIDLEKSSRFVCVD